VVLLDVYEGPDNPVVKKTLKQHKQFLLGCTRWFCYGFGAAIMWRILNWGGNLGQARPCSQFWNLPRRCDHTKTRPAGGWPTQARCWLEWGCSYVTDTAPADKL